MMRDGLRSRDGPAIGRIEVRRKMVFTLGRAKKNHGTCDGSGGDELTGAPISPPPPRTLDQ